MEFVTVAEGTSFQELAKAMPNKGLPKGTPFRIVMELNLPVAWAFDLAGAELLFYPVTPPGLELKDVHSDGPSRVIVETEADPAWLVAIGAFLIEHWLGLSLVTIGISLALGWLISTIRGEVPAGTNFLTPFTDVLKWVTIAGVSLLTVGTVAYVVAKAK